MNRTHKKNYSSSFNKFVAHLQRTFSSKNTKSSTVIIQQQQQQPSRSYLSTFTNRFQLSDILYNPSRSIEYLSEIKDQDDYSYSFSCYNSINTHQEDEFNLSQMNISMNNNYDHCSRQKLIKLPIRLHSTAIDDISNC
ncbi:unnamed protein product [Rotaria sordida]|uniref:Uncharacterized protein n=1 Tax=Rotaria sordida TaxID=392033 RepID=A0A819J9R1_9BILA|nr:unnamed protein product [Rotaria sordida]CAF0948646.1 unnamed protein product [Rotaria sordida]CAF3811966.1 unnamed protein product [Rotaria sordida]CAF3927151.1 unnamed protein product [Rotaria sordida]